MHKLAGERIQYLILILFISFLFIENVAAQNTRNHRAEVVAESTRLASIPDSVSATGTLPNTHLAEKSNSAAQSEKAIADYGDIGSWWELTKLGGTLRWPIFAVFAIGLILIVQKLVVLIREHYQSRSLLTAPIGTMSLEEITQTIDESPKNMIKELFKMLMEIFETAGQASSFNQEITNFVTYQQDRFQTFKTRMIFLSDSAGALGLLGTVWGMFETFFGGNLEKQVILDGMGVALITTLMGLVVSLILNFFSTEIFTQFNKRLEEMQLKADEFRLRISRIEKSRQKKVESERRLLESEVEASRAVTKNATPNLPTRETLGPPYKLVYIAGDGQNTAVNSRLTNPFVVELQDAFENKLGGQLVRFGIEKGDGSFSNGGKIQEIITNREGRAVTYLTTGTGAGENIVRTSSPGLNGQYVEFVARSEAGQPETMSLISGNNLAGPAGFPLNESFVVAVRDAFNNPIPNIQVTFKVSMGNGFFAGKTSKYTVITDAKGLAQAYFTLGTRKGFNHIVVTAKKLRRAKIEIQAIGQ
jgi:biopolymer transport protein ExbB/TolQ